MINGFRIIAPPIATPSAGGGDPQWSHPELPIFIRVCKGPCPYFPRWVLYGGPMQNMHWNAVNDFIIKYFQSQAGYAGFTPSTERVAVAPHNFQPWPRKTFQWEWAWEPTKPPSYRVSKWAPLSWEQVA